ncbi:MAG: YceK/YidQ family lipoprotein, partial [Verrucomicrobiaceae bacterium]
MRQRMEYLSVLLCSIICSVSCSTISTHVDDPEVAKPYSGTAKALGTLKSEDGFLVIPDIPLSLVADTIMLPEAMRAQKTNGASEAVELPPQRPSRLASARPKPSPDFE